MRNRHVLPCFFTYLRSTGERVSFRAEWWDGKPVEVTVFIDHEETGRVRTFRDEVAARAFALAFKRDDEEQARRIVEENTRAL